MRKMIKLPSLMLLCCLQIALFAQVQLDSSDFSYSVKLTPDLNSINSTDTLYFHKIIVDLEDTSLVSKISVKIGTAEGWGDIETYDFVYDVNTFLPSGYSYYRNKNMVTLVMGKHSAALYYFEVKLYDTLGNSTEVKKWNTWNL